MAKKSKKQLIHPSMPAQGAVAPSFQGSQSEAPGKSDPYVDPVQNALGAPPMGGQY